MSRAENKDRFSCSFRYFGENGFSPQAWEPRFLCYDAEEWEEAGGWNIIYFASEDKMQYSLMVVHVENRGFVLNFYCYSPQDNRIVSSKYAVADPMALSRSDFEDVGDDDFFPTGCILAPAKAWITVKDFLEEPTRPSSRTLWAEDDDLDWPDY